MTYLPKYFFVFDVESLGLYGDAFAVGWVVVNTSTRLEVESGLLVLPERTWWWSLPDMQPSAASKWSMEHCEHLRGKCNVASPYGMKDAFFARWVHWKDNGAVMAADCPFPVESNFLLQASMDNGFNPMPYPLIDVGSVLLSKGVDPTAEYERCQDELPKHNPLCDARQSARLLLNCLPATPTAGGIW